MNYRIEDSVLNYNDFFLNAVILNIIFNVQYIRQKIWNSRQNSLFIRTTYCKNTFFYTWKNSRPEFFLHDYFVLGEWKCIIFSRYFCKLFRILFIEYTVNTGFGSAYWLFGLSVASQSFSFTTHIPTGHTFFSRRRESAATFRCRSSVRLGFVPHNMTLCHSITNITL